MGGAGACPLPSLARPPATRAPASAGVPAGGHTPFPTSGGGGFRAGRRQPRAPADPRERERRGGARRAGGRRGEGKVARRGGAPSLAPVTVRAGGALPALHRASRPGLRARRRSRRSRGGSLLPRSSPPLRRSAAGPSPPDGRGGGRPRASPRSGRRRRTPVAGARAPPARAAARVRPSPALLGAARRSRPACGREGCSARPLPEASPPLPSSLLLVGRRPAVRPSPPRRAMAKGEGEGRRAAFGARRRRLLRPFPQRGEGASAARPSPRSRPSGPWRGRGTARAGPPGVPGRPSGRVRAREPPARGVASAASRPGRARFSAAGPRPRSGGAARAAAVLSGAAPGY